MKGVILSGGNGTRLYPLTKVTNKNLLPVGEVPMIYHPVRKLTEIGIKEICIVTGSSHTGDLVNVLGSGKEFGCRFTYNVQDEAGGIAQALGLVENFAGDEPICMILGDNIFEDSLWSYADQYKKQWKQRGGARLMLKAVHDPERFGVVEVDDDRVLSIEEKPANPKSNLIATGIYFYDSVVFEIIKGLKPSARGELEITDVNNAYLEDGMLEFDVFNGFWIDAGTFDSLQLANELVRKTGQGKA